MNAFTEPNATIFTLTVLPFCLPESLAINAARLAHLASLGLSLENRSVLEPGAGIGLLTEFWEQRNCRVISLDLQPENVNLNRSHHPNRKNVICRSVEAGLADLGQFDIVFCYGLLYHVSNPLQCLKDMALVCDDLLLLETMVHPVDDGQLHLYPQRSGADQGTAGAAYRPARNWVMAILLDLFPYAYVSCTQPNYPDFPLEWPASGEVCRSIFVAARRPLELPTLRDNLPMRQARFEL